MEGRLAPNGLPTGKKAETSPSVDLTNEVHVQHVGTCKISLERAEEKSTVDRPGLVCSSHIYSPMPRNPFDVGDSIFKPYSALDDYI